MNTKQQVWENDRIRYREKNIKHTKRERIIWAEIEDESVKLLEGSKKICRPCDIEWKGKLVDVKVARYEKAFTVKNKKGEKQYSWRWRFALKRQKGIADYFLCMGYDKDGKKTEFIMLIPDKDIKTLNISISLMNYHKYAHYLLDWRPY